MKDKNNKKGIIVINGEISSMEVHGLKRIKDCSPVKVDILHDVEPNAGILADYAWLLVLKNSSEKHTFVNKEDESDIDTWEVEVCGDNPVQVKIHADTGRARMYALYHIASCLEEGQPAAAWSVSRRPLLSHRYAWISAGNVWSEVFRPDWYNRDIAELPPMGINGVVITCTPTHGTSIGRQTIPFELTNDGVKVDKFKLPAFQSMFNQLKSYGLEICLMHQGFTPPSYTPEEVREYYDGKRILHDFEDEVEKSSYSMATAIFTQLPQVDSLLYHSLECEWMWGDAVSIFPCKDDVVGERAFEAYLNGLTKACQEFGKDLLFWTHVSGISASQILLMHRVLARYPEVVVVEDHAWPNNSWPHVPVMGHLSTNIKKDVVKGRLALSINLTDGEYYGAGALPTSYPEPHIHAAQTAVKYKAEYAYVRINEQSLTPLGTLKEINAINVLSASEQWWDPARSTDELWKKWCDHRFGDKASSKIISALKKSKTIITKGFSASGLPLMDHSGLPVGNWKPTTGINAYAIFARPGKLLVDKSYDKLEINDFRAWQVGARGVELEEFLSDSIQAEDEASKALSEINSVRDCLTYEDFEYLTTCYQDALLMIEAIRMTAVAARASALYLEEGGEINIKILEDACTDMEVCADKIETERGQNFRALQFFQKTMLKGREYTGYGVPIALRAISEIYRKLI